MSIKKQLLVALLLLVVGGGVVWVLSHHKTPPKRASKRKSIPVVKTMVVHSTHYRVVIHTYGEVKARDKAIITPEVKGKVVYISPHFYAGCRVKRGECLVKLDRRDFEIYLCQAEADLKKALADMAQLKEEAIQARQEWRLIHPHKEIPPLVAKIPQLKALKGRVEAARANVRLAKLNLERTEIHAPFDGIVVSRDVDIGQVVSPGQRLALIYSASSVEVHIPLSLNQVQWLKIPGYSEVLSHPQEVEISFNMGRRSVKYRGKIVRCLGEIDPKSRMLYAVAEVKDPFKRIPPLLPNTFVDVRIKGKEIYPAFLLPVSAIHENCCVFKIKRGRIKVEKVDVAYRLKDKVVVKTGLEDGDVVVISPLAGDVNGLKVRVER